MLEGREQTIDVKPPTKESNLANPDLKDGGHPINWDISPDGKTLWCVAMSTNQLYDYDLTANETIDLLQMQTERYEAQGGKLEARDSRAIPFSTAINSLNAATGG